MSKVEMYCSQCARHSHNGILSHAKDCDSGLSVQSVAALNVAPDITQTITSNGVNNDGSPIQTPLKHHNELRYRTNKLAVDIRENWQAHNRTGDYKQGQEKEQRLIDRYLQDISAHFSSAIRKDSNG